MKKTILVMFLAVLCLPVLAADESGNQLSVVTSLDELEPDVLANLGSFCQIYVAEEPGQGQPREAAAEVNFVPSSDVTAENADRIIVCRADCDWKVGTLKCRLTAEDVKYLGKMEPMVSGPFMLYIKFLDPEGLSKLAPEIFYLVVVTDLETGNYYYVVIDFVAG